MIQTTRELVTPEMAAALLETNKNNRTVMKMRVDAMARDMAEGHWLETHQGIALNCDGSLKDGQHRLLAIIQSGTSQWFWVFRNLPDEAMKVIDTSKPRSIQDVMTIEGTKVGRNQVSIARRMILGGSAKDKFSRHEVMAAVVQHWDAVNFAFDASGKRGLVCHASITAPVARAWYTRDRDRLLEYLGSLKSSVVTRDQDSAVATLVRYYLANKSVVSGGIESRATLYRKSTSALVAFLEGRPLSKLYECKLEPFPIPALEVP